MPYVIDESLVSLDNGQKIRFDYPIGEALDFGEQFLVRLNIPRGLHYNRNVFGVHRTEGIIWQLQDVFPAEEFIPIGSMHAENGRAVLATWTGWAVIIDPKTGTVLEKRDVPR